MFESKVTGKSEALAYSVLTTLQFFNKIPIGKLNKPSPGKPGRPSLSQSSLRKKDVDYQKKKTKWRESEGVQHRDWVAAGNEGERETRQDAGRKQLSPDIRMLWRHLTGRESCSLQLSFHRRPRTTFLFLQPASSRQHVCGQTGSCSLRWDARSLSTCIANVLVPCAWVFGRRCHMENPPNTKPLCTRVSCDSGQNMLHHLY